MPSGPASCCVCGARDARVLVVDLPLPGGARVTLCGSHATARERAAPGARTPAELRAALAERRGRRERRRPGDELGDALVAAFSGQRRLEDRRA